MYFPVARLTQRHQVGERVFPPMLSVDDMVGFQAAMPLPTLSTLVSVPRETSNPEILIQPHRDPILWPVKVGLTEPGDIHLHILDDDLKDR